MKKVLWVLLALAVLALVVALAWWLIAWVIGTLIPWILEKILWVIGGFTVFAIFCMAIDN